MAGSITHIAVADKVAEKLSSQIASVPLFFNGNIAPDCIHSRENFVRAMKKHTHLRDDIRDHDFIKEESQAIFQKRLDGFVEKYCIKGDAEFDLYCGYLSHLMTDEFFMKTIRQEFTAKMDKLGIKQSDRDYYLMFMSDINNIDNRLSQQYEFKNNPKDTLWDAKDLEIKDYLTVDEFTDGKGWITWNWFDNKRDFVEPKYISYDRIIDFIDKASEEIVRRFNKYKLYQLEV